MRTVLAVRPVSCVRRTRLFSPLFAMLILSSIGCHRAPNADLPKKLLIEVTGNEFEWYVRYAGNDETLGTDDDYFSKRNITLLAGTQTKIDLKSDDYLYSFALPHLELKEIAVPDILFSLNFTPKETGEFKLQGDQLCGFQHPKLIGKVRVLGKKEFGHWVKQKSSDR